MFFKAWKLKKVADGVLAQVQPDVRAIAQLLGGIPESLVSNHYVLGYFCVSIGIAMQRASREKLTSEDQGKVLFLVMDYLFAGHRPDHALLASLLGGANKSEEFTKGATAANKVLATAAGFSDFQNDADVLAAREVVRRAGDSLEYLAPGASENSKVSGELLRALLYQVVMDQYRAK